MLFWIKPHDVNHEKYMSTSRPCHFKITNYNLLLKYGTWYYVYNTYYTCNMLECSTILDLCSLCEGGVVKCCTGHCLYLQMYYHRYCLKKINDHLNTLWQDLVLRLTTHEQICHTDPRPIIQLNLSSLSCIFKLNIIHKEIRQVRYFKTKIKVWPLMYILHIKYHKD